MANQPALRPSERPDAADDLVIPQGDKPKPHSPVASNEDGQSHRYRWVILAVGVLAQASLSALQNGLPALGPMLRSSFGLSLPELGLVLASANWGIMSTLLLWGALADRQGERFVIAAGLGGCALCILVASNMEGVAGLVTWLALAGALGSAASAASGRAVMQWFSRRERGFALGIRQMSVPLGGAVAALALPLIAASLGLKVAFLAQACAAVFGGLCAALWLSTPQALSLPRVWICRRPYATGRYGVSPSARVCSSFAKWP